ncbi:MAG: sensor histidine kinase, partial [Actinomycetota bacterium]
MEQDTAGPATGRDDSKNERLAYLVLASALVLALISPPVGAWFLPGAVMAVLGYRTYATQREQRRRREDLIHELEASLEEAAASSQMKDDFIATVSHELRTPLTAIQGSAKTLLQADVAYDEETQRMLLEAVDRQSERLRRLIEDLLVAARMDWRGLHAIVGPVSLSDLTRQVVDGFGSRIETHRIRLDTADGPLSLRTDRQRIEQIVSNLLDNALKYSPRGSTVTVSVRSARNGAEIAVADEGPGVPDKLRDKIFERFYQV